KFKYIC
ncbi:guanine nucleotide-releasing factor 2, partial [Caerostris darwini]